MPREINKELESRALRVPMSVPVLRPTDPHTAGLRLFHARRWSLFLGRTPGKNPRGNDQSCWFILLGAWLWPGLTRASSVYSTTKHYCLTGRISFPSVLGSFFDLSSILPVLYLLVSSCVYTYNHRRIGGEGEERVLNIEGIRRHYKYVITILSLFLGLNFNQSLNCSLIIIIGLYSVFPHTKATSSVFFTRCKGQKEVIP